jgi:hypothetical protein
MPWPLPKRRPSKSEEPAAAAETAKADEIRISDDEEDIED